MLHSSRDVRGRELRGVFDTVNLFIHVKLRSAASHVNPTRGKENKTAVVIMSGIFSEVPQEASGLQKESVFIFYLQFLRKSLTLLLHKNPKKKYNCQLHVFPVFCNRCKYHTILKLNIGSKISYVNFILQSQPFMISCSHRPHRTHKRRNFI